MHTDPKVADVKEVTPTRYTIDGSGIDGKDQPLQVDWTAKEERNAKRK